jgi:phage-related protein
MMAIEHFAWKIQAASQPTLSSKDTVRTAQFGDGYKQVSGSGLNDEVLNYAFSFTGDPVIARRFIHFCGGIKPSLSHSLHLVVI